MTPGEVSDRSRNRTARVVSQSSRVAADSKGILTLNDVIELLSEET
jgi:hypothetical protein